MRSEGILKSSNMPIVSVNRCNGYAFYPDHLCWFCTQWMVKCYNCSLPVFKKEFQVNRVITGPSHVHAYPVKFLKESYLVRYLTIFSLKNILYSSQHGFCKNRSTGTTTNLLESLNDLTLSILSIKTNTLWSTSTSVKLLMLFHIPSYLLSYKIMVHAVQ